MLPSFIFMSIQYQSINVVGKHVYSNMLFVELRKTERGKHKICIFVLNIRLLNESIIPYVPSIRRRSGFLRHKEI